MRKSKKTSSSAGREFELFDDLMPVRRYKLLLQTFLKRRGPGARQTIAESLGHTRSFVTQITSPAYDLAIPASQVRAILKLAELTSEEERIFLDAYVDAHPERAAEVYAASQHALTIALPDLGDPSAQARLEELIRRIAEAAIDSFVDTRARQAGRAA
ncbi:hypothetical protein IED13_20865 [Bosea sp. SSUT16]|jgi:hypothetical protein|uniref:Uncharacterized protein n=1 Tax=Bosea spartocytisi TaxID=2773451 RepID=A0A927I2X8_9HYPH|nr:hypothetical protein [Bosea spartocytisi]MBD3848158.1 hypothetical protein [Bosea spartocytisi]MCT4474008.1 hypothetical protein [Bosea spartocytisi]